MAEQKKNTKNPKSAPSSARNRAAAKKKRQERERKVMLMGIAIIAVIILLIVLLAKGCSKTDPAPKVEIDIEGYGTIKLELDGKTAPITVENFVGLVEDGFYNGLTFHRIINGFMMQGGDPKGDGTGGSEATIKGEFSANGVENSISHVRGTISMARSGRSMDSASSQFFIVQTDSTYLDGQYAAFGHVTEGMEIVDQICKDAQVEDANGTVLPANQPVITEIRIVK